MGCQVKALDKDGFNPSELIYQGRIKAERWPSILSLFYRIVDLCPVTL